MEWPVLNPASLPVPTLAVLLLAVVTFLGVFAVAQAQQADGAISGLTLTTDSPEPSLSPGTRPARRPPTTA